jgi:hypothetical protein
MHITSSLVDGPVPKELCIIPTLREHDFGGQLNRGHLTGAVSFFLFISLLFLSLHLTFFSISQFFNDGSLSVPHRCQEAERGGG